MPFILNSFGWTGGGGGGITPVTGNGTATYLPIWTAATVIGDSIVRQNATNTAVLIGSTFIADNSLTRVGIGLVASMGATLHVKGSGATSATSSLIIQNSTPTTLFEIKDDGQVSSTYGYWQGANKILYINPNSTTANLFVGYTSGNNTLTGNYNTAIGSYSQYSITTGNNNTSLGYTALQLITEGTYNIGIGIDGARGITTGSYNIGIGNTTLYTVNTGSNNVAIGGTQCMSNTPSGVSNNVAVGSRALKFTQTSYQTAIGDGALSLNTTGANNVAIGYQTLYNNTFGNGNTGIGYTVLQDNTIGGQNTALGNLALKSNTIGNTSTAIGSNALATNTEGNANNAFGANALLSNLTGSNNNAFGYGALQNNTGSFNTAFGHGAMLGNTTGYLNIAFGYAAMDSCAAGTIYNTAIGVYALRYVNSNFNTAVGYNALGNITTGHTNIAVGYRAGEVITGGVTANQTSNSSIYIGYLTKPSADGNTNEIIIGYDIVGNGSNSVTLGNTSITKTILQGRVGIGTVTPNSMLHNAGSLSETKITTVTIGVHTVLATEYIFNCTGDCTLELPSIAATDIGIGKVYKIYAAEAVTVTITPDGADTIDNAATASVVGWGMITLRCLSAGNWRVGD